MNIFIFAKFGNYKKGKRDNKVIKLINIYPKYVFLILKKQKQKNDE